MLFLPGRHILIMQPQKSQTQTKENMTKHQVQDKIEKRAREILVGKTIQSLGYLDENEKNNLLWDKSAIVLELNDGTLLFPSMDDEGNEAGAMFIQTEKELERIPVI